MNESHPSNKKKTAQTQPGGNLDEAFKKEPTIKDDLVLSGAAIIEDYVKRLPAKPGVYRMIGEKGDILYVGKAKDLSKRVVSYTNLRGHSNRIQRMITATRTMEFVITETETEALLLEANLIKTLKPRYNVLLRDDKSFPYILIADDHKSPQLLKHRGARKRPGHYFGPFASATAVNNTLNTLQKAFLLRSCTDNIYDNRTRPCLLHQIKRCAAPCVDLIEPKDYDGLVEEARNFLSGDDHKIQKELSKKMEQAAEELDFEKAAALRDRIRALSFVQGSQDINADTIDNADIFAADEQGGQTCVQVFFFRAYQNLGNHSYFPRHDKEESMDSILNAFIAQFYDNREPPPLILTSQKPAQAELLMEALTLKGQRKVQIHTPERGEKREVMGNALMNAKEALTRRLAEASSQARNLKAVSEIVGYQGEMRRIEVYDNSHIQGSHAVGGMIVAGPDGFEKNQYRKFNIKNENLSPGDDFGMMREVLMRRFSKALKADPFSHEQWPDLIILDGGKGQLSAAIQIFEELGLDIKQAGLEPEKDKSDLDTAVVSSGDSVSSADQSAIKPPLIVSIAKPKKESEKGQKTSDRTMGAMAEQIFLPGKDPFLIPPRNPALFFIQRLRDEAHRYAISAHRAKRKKAISANPIDDIPGVGAARKRALLNHFGSAKSIASAKPQDLSVVEGISEALAQRIFDFFNGG